MDLMHIYRHPMRLYILAFNILAMIGSVGLTAVGIIGLTSNTRLLLDSSILSWTSIALSLFIFLVSLLGCAAALANSKSVLSSYGVMISLLILLQLSVIIFALSRHDKVDGILDNAWQRVYDNNPRILQDIETRLACCGYSSVGDRAVPKTSKYACRESPAFGYTVSCQRQIKGAYLDHEDLLLSVVTSIQFLQILALVAAVALWSQLPRSNEIEDRYRVEHSQRLLRGMREDQAQRGYRDTGGQGEEQERYGATEWSNR